MKKLTYLMVLTLILGLVLTGCSLLSNVGQVPATSQTKVKPEGLGAQTYAWYLSADVMPVPPYGSRDIPGSDSASKLIVNQPNGAVEVTITGVMNGLNPNTTYTVYLSKEYDPYVDTGWNVTGDDWVLSVTLGSNIYPEDTIFLQIGDSIPGSTSLAGSLLYASSLWTIYEGKVVGSAIEFRATFEPSCTRTVHFWGTIAADGTMSGSWADDYPYTRSGAWASTDGVAVRTHTGDTGWSGLFTSTVQPFPFTTDEFGSGSWHINLRDSHFGDAPRDYTLSVWINNGTILISDNFDVTVD